MNKKNTPGHSKIKASEAPGRLPGGSRAPPKQGIKTDPVLVRKGEISGPPFMLMYVENQVQNEAPKTHQNYVEYMLDSSSELRASALEHFGALIPLVWQQKRPKFGHLHACHYDKLKF